MKTIYFENYILTTIDLREAWSKNIQQSRFIQYVLYWIKSFFSYRSYFLSLVLWSVHCVSYIALPQRNCVLNDRVNQSLYAAQGIIYKNNVALYASWKIELGSSFMWGRSNLQGNFSTKISISLSIGLLPS